jgi:hypothetical protein
MTLEMALLEDLEQCLDGNDPGPSTQAAILLGVGMVSAPSVRSWRARTRHLKHRDFPVRLETASPGRGSVRCSCPVSFVMDPGFTVRVVCHACSIARDVRHQHRDTTVMEDLLLDRRATHERSAALP